MTRPVGNMRGMTDLSEATSPTRRFAPLAIIIAIPLLVAAIFYFVTPVVLETGGEQGIFKCGSPSSPNADAENVCSQPEKVQRNQAIFSGLAGVGLLALGTVWLLRGQRRDEDEWDDDDHDYRRRDDDHDVRETRERGRRADRGHGGGLHGPSRDRGTDRPRSRAADDDFATDTGAERDATETRSSRHAPGGRRSVLRDDDFADRPARRSADADDDWSSDGWR